jgi:hypothetical protein
MNAILLPRWVPYELRRLGRVGLLLPALTAVPFALFAAFMQLSGSEPPQLSRMLAAYLEAGLPLAAGLAAASVVAEDPALDLQLSFETRYRTTVLRRLGALLSISALCAVLWSSALRLSGLWGAWVREPFVWGQLVWLSPLLFCAALGAVLALLLRGRTAAGAVLGGLWLVQMLFAGHFLTNGWLRPFYLFATLRAPGADFWLDNRLALVGAAVALLAVFAVLFRSEALVLGGES